MNISICITVFNEEKTISGLLDSLISQSKKPDEIIIVDGGSKDKTIEIIRHFQKRYGNIKLLTENCSRSAGRNISVDVAKNEIIATTDAGCIVHKNWLKNITEPFVNREVDIVAGFYEMTGRSSMQKAMAIFLGVMPSKFDINFLPSTRSMAFRKKAWEEIGGFPEGRENSAEDTDFNYKALRLGLKYARVKTAIVEWGMPEDLTAFFNKISDYAKWDIRYGIWWNPAQRFASHNIKALSVLFRYLIALLILIYCFYKPPLFPIPVILIFAYFVWSYRKVFSEFQKASIAVWGPILQIVCDFGVMNGFLRGLVLKGAS